MPGFLLFVLFLVIVAGVVVQVLRRRGITVLDADGRRRLPGAPALARMISGVLAALFLILLIPASVRVVPVGHGLVIFNTLTRSFRLARQGVNLIPPFITQTQDYDLRRLEYTMTGTRGEGRKSDWDDSLWSPTQEGLQVGVDLTIWSWTSTPPGARRSRMKSTRGSRTWCRRTALS
jgi:hypothetical protein